MDHLHHQSEQPNGAHSCCTPKQQFDYLLWSSTAIIVISYACYLLFPLVANVNPLLYEFNMSVYELINTMWHGILLGLLFVGILAGVPKQLVFSILGQGGTFGGIVRATAGGVFLDLCSHGILLVGMQLYKRGASLGQVMAFLIASPWNSISLTVILWTLVGLKWTLMVVLLSLLIAIISGMIFDHLEKKGVLPPNPNRHDERTHNGFWIELKGYLNTIKWTPQALISTLWVGLKESKMILRWIFFGIVLAALIRASVSTELFVQLFGPTLLGLGATLIFATVLEVCSEGSMPVAADFLLRAKAPGNTFAFLMTGVSTDYTEMFSLKETTGSWKIAFFLPLVTLPQIVLIAILLNHFSVST